MSLLKSSQSDFLLKSGDRRIKSIGHGNWLFKKTVSRVRVCQRVSSDNHCEFALAVYLVEFLCTVT